MPHGSQASGSTDRTEAALREAVLALLGRTQGGGGVVAHVPQHLATAEHGQAVLHEQEVRLLGDDAPDRFGAVRHLSHDMHAPVGERRGDAATEPRVTVGEDRRHAAVMCMGCAPSAKVHSGLSDHGVVRPQEDVGAARPVEASLT